MRYLTLGILCLVLSACQTTAPQPTNIQIGITKIKADGKDMQSLNNSNKAAVAQIDIRGTKVNLSAEDIKTLAQKLKATLK